MTESEKTVEKSFDEYRSMGLAELNFVFPRMRPCGKSGTGMLLWVQVAKAPFDVAGYMMEGGKTVACEIKENSERTTAMTIVDAGKKGTGLQYHQLAALVAVHKAGGYACVVWDNGGEWGLLDGQRLTHAKAAFDTAKKAKEEGYPRASRGSFSILWGNFQRISFTPKGVPIWLNLLVPQTPETPT
jgi:hypothetical protein